MDELTPLTTEKGQWSGVEPWMEPFLAALSEYGNVSEACRRAGISRFTAYKHRHTDALFAQKWALAAELGLDGLEDRVRERAYHESDTLAIFLLKAGRPEKYRERVEQRQVLITPDQAKEMTDAEIEAELQKKGLL